MCFYCDGFSIHVKLRGITEAMYTVILINFVRISTKRLCIAFAVIEAVYVEN